MRNVMASVIYCSFHLAITDCKKLHSQPHIHPVHSTEWGVKSVSEFCFAIGLFFNLVTSLNWFSSVLIKFDIEIVCSRFFSLHFYDLWALHHSLFTEIFLSYSFSCTANKTHNEQFQFMNDWGWAENEGRNEINELWKKKMRIKLFLWWKLWNFKNKLKNFLPLCVQTDKSSIKKVRSRLDRNLQAIKVKEKF